MLSIFTKEECYHILWNSGRDHRSEAGEERRRDEEKCTGAPKGDLSSALNLV